MIKNLIKTAFRSLLKNKGFTFINIIGLALGLATCLLIMLYVFDELSYDKFNTNHQRIYRVNTDLNYGGTLSSFAIAAPPVAGALKAELPEVENAVRLSAAQNIRFKKSEEVINEKDVFYCDSSIFAVFTLPLIEGDAKTALTTPNSIVISAAAAKKYFNTTAALGKTLTIPNDSVPRRITGVMQDMPAQSHFKADFLMPLSAERDNNWARFTFNTYILLKLAANTAGLEAKMNALLVKNINSAAFNYQKFAASGNYIKLNLTPLTGIHLTSNRQRELGPNGNIQYVYIFMGIAGFILLLACINFMNLSTARSTNRAREVGVRKVLGAKRRFIIAQFLAESVLVTLVATLVAAFAGWALLSLFNQISGKVLSVSWQNLKWVLPTLLLIAFSVGLLAGSYPAFFLSRFKPIQVLKGKLSVGFKGGALRNALVIFQFTISIFLIIGTLVVYNQLNYIQNKDLGFNRNQVLVLKNVSTISNPVLLKQSVQQLPGVVDATLTSYLPTGTTRWPNNITAADGKSLQTELWPVDAGYLHTMGMQLKSGRDFSESNLSDSSSIIINQTAANMLGYTGGAFEKIKNGGREYTVIGVVRDFNFSSLRDNISPLVLVMNRDFMASLSIRVNTKNLAGIMAQIESKWKALSPNQKMEYTFMDEDFNAIYSNEQRLSKLFVLFTALAIIIACLGLFGLAAYAAEQRSREIGIRKVLGADVSRIVAMLSADFVKLVAIAVAIASPLAWLAMHKWLDAFAYRDSIHWWVFVLAAAGALAVALLTVSYQSIKAAIINPVESLRSE